MDREHMSDAVPASAERLWSPFEGLPGTSLMVGENQGALLEAGAVIPIVLTSLGQDPAQASSIILTTVTGVAGFFMLPRDRDGAGGDAVSMTQSGPLPTSLAHRIVRGRGAPFSSRRERFRERGESGASCVAPQRS